MPIPVEEKTIKAFKKQHDGEPELGAMDSDDKVSISLSCLCVRLSVQASALVVAACQL